MSEYLIEAIDNLTLAVESLQTALAPVDNSTQLQAIADNIAAQNDTDVDYSTALQAIADAINYRYCCPQLKEPLVVYDCSTSTVIWIDPEDGTIHTDPPPTRWAWPPAADSPEDRPPSEGVIIWDEETDDPPTYTEDDPPYGTAPNDGAGFNNTTITRDVDSERCRKANVFVRMCYDMLVEMSDLMNTTAGLAIDAFLFLPSVKAWSQGSRYFTSKTLGIVEFLVKNSYLITVFEWVRKAGELLGFQIVNFTIGWTAAVIEDLVCAIYNATSERDLKKRWDAVVDNHYDWFAPQAVLIRMFMNGKWTGPLLDNDLVAKTEVTGYSVVCGTACAPPQRIFNSMPVYLEARPGVGLAAGTYHVIDISTGNTDGLTLLTWTGHVSHGGDDDFEYFNTRVFWIEVLSGGFEYLRQSNDITLQYTRVVTGDVFAPTPHATPEAFIFDASPFSVKIHESDPT